MGTIIDLFTGSSKWLYIALIILGLGFVGISSLSLSLYGDKTALNATVKAKDGMISDLNTTLQSKEKKIEELNDTLLKKRTEIATQNTRIKELEADKKAGLEKAQKAVQAISEKYENLRQTLNFKVDDNASANDVKHFVNSFDWMR